jgi:MYXO-CTERM domain-containing protein
VYDSAVGRQPPQSVGSSYSARWGTAFADCSDATSDFDQIACFSNSSARVDLLAPGAPILSDSLNGRTELYWGTSQASPAAVGVAALLLQCAPSLTPAQLKQALVDSGVKRTDTRNGLTFPSVRALAAVRAVCAESSPEFPGMPGTARDAGVVAATDAALPTPGPLAPDVSAPLPDGGALPPTPRDAALLPVGDAAFQPGKPTTSVDCDCSVAGLPGGGRHDHAAWLALAALVTFGARRRRGFWAARGA